jgi:hypothetical protein
MKILLEAVNMWKIDLLIFLAIFCLTTLPEVPTWATTHYVGPGQSIQAAIDAANTGDQIEVAPGVYQGAISFNAKAIRLYSSGGREVTTIDGGGADHVVQCVYHEGPGTVLEGFTITGGSATGSSPDDCGGGMIILDSVPTVKDCIFTGNYADGSGGGMYNRRSIPIVLNCVFDRNSAFHNGGGMVNYENSGASVVGCTFRDNTASNGGGMFNYFSSPTLTDCVFMGNSLLNSPNTFGGGMDNYSSSPRVTNCTFIENKAGYGAAISNTNLDPPVGGVSNPRLINCVFCGNSASSKGGVMLSIGNTGTYSEPTMTNCTFSGNTAGDGGSVLCNWTNSRPRLTNCILWGNSPDPIFTGDGTATVTYCDVQNGWSGTGNIAVDPRFVTTAGPDFPHWNLRLKMDSPCIDAGDTTAVSTPLDRDKNPRAVDSPYVANTGRSVSASLNVVDMGAYESGCNSTADNNCDGVVNLGDMAILASHWLEDHSVLR